MKKQKLVAVLAAVLAMSMGITGCGGAGNEEDVSEEKENVTITFSTFNQWYNDGLKAGIAKYEEKTGNKVEVQVYPDDQFTNLIMTKMATGDVPDVIGIHPQTNMWPSLVDKVEPLEGEWTEKLLPSTASKVVRESDGNIVAAPYGACSSVGVSYNKQIFEDAGVELPLKTYEEFLDACEKIKATGVTPIYLPNKDNWTAQIFLLCSMNAVFEKDNTLAEKLMTNQIKPSEIPEMVEMCNRIVELKDKGYMNEDLNSATYDMAVGAVANGEAAMFLCGDWNYADYQNDYPDAVDNIGFMPMTLDDEYIFANVGASGYGLWVPTEAENKEAALEFVDIMMSEEVMQEMYEKIPGICPVEGYEVSMSPWNEEMLMYGESMPIQDDFKGTYLPGFNVGNFSNYIQGIMAGQTVEQALDDWYSDYAHVNQASKTEGFE